MAELEDWESFIACVEETAQKEDEGPRGKKLFCQDCDVPYEDIEGEFVCPECQAQAPYLAHIEETEMVYDDMGQAILGQRVSTMVKKKPFECDYGWAWSTDETVFHILCLQIDALEQLGLVSRFFRDGIANMWLKFWDENIAPYIKDEYNEEDLIPMEITKVFKYRDIEVLIKMKDRVMIPKRVTKKPPIRQRRYHRKDNTRMRRVQLIEQQSACTPTPDILDINPDEQANQIILDDQESKTHSEDLKRTPLTTEENNNMIDFQDINELTQQTTGRTRTLGRDNIAILTLNRTLAFIEATARCLDQAKPIFASDIIRLCCQRLIPFFGAQNSLPDQVKLHSKDKLMFQKTKPPTPSQLTRTACLLICKTYNDRLPFRLPVPSLDKILERFISDLNLPYDLLKYIREGISFSDFVQTQSRELFESTRAGNRKLPQYDRWAYAMLVCQLKKLFHLSDPMITKLGEQARKLEESESHETQRYFNLLDWSNQLSIRLKLVMNYDPFMLYHPMTEMNGLEPSPQMYTYLETIIQDRPMSQIRAHQSQFRFDKVFRNDLTDFLKGHIPKPPNIRNLIEDEPDLEKPRDLRHPLNDALNRTKKYWQDNLRGDPDLSDLVMRNFVHDKVTIPDTIEQWDLFGPGARGRTYTIRINDDWPYCFRLLLSVGGYLCFCEPRELLQEIRFIEQFLHPKRKTRKKTVRKTKRKKRICRKSNSANQSESDSGAIKQELSEQNQPEAEEDHEDEVDEEEEEEND